MRQKEIQSGSLEARHYGGFPYLARVSLCNSIQRNTIKGYIRSTYLLTKRSTNGQLHYSPCILETQGQ